MNLNQTHGGAGQPPTTLGTGEIFAAPKENAGPAPHETGIPHTTTSESQYTPTSDTPQAGNAAGVIDPEDQVALFPAPAESGIYGVAAQSWDLMTQALGGIEHLRPTVCNPQSWNDRGWTRDGRRQCAGGSFTKTPCAIGPRGVHGIKDWPTRTPTPDDVVMWASNPDIGIGVATSHHRCFDLDVENANTVAAILEVIRRHLGEDRWARTPVRHRNNAARKSLLITVQGVVPRKKIKTAHGDIELLGNGCFTLWAGTHASGARLQHENILAAAEHGIAELSADEAIALWDELARTFAVDPATVGGFFDGKAGGSVDGIAASDPVGEWLLAQGLVQSADGGKLHIDCPFQGQHTSSPGITPVGSASWLPRTVDATGQVIAEARFKCMHAGCKPHSDDRWEALRKLGVPEELYRKPATRVQADLSMLSGVPRPEGMPATVGLSAAPAQPAAPKRYTLQSAEEFLSKPPISWYLRHILPRNGVEVIYGPSRAGKTFIVLDLVLSLLDDSRDEWFGHDIRNRPAGVVYMAMEGAYGVRARVKAWTTNNGGDLPQNMLFLEGQAFNMLQAADVEALAAAVVEHFPQNAVVVIDTQAKAAAGADEQAAKDMGLVYLAAERIAQATGGLVILVAHTGKDVEKGIRGSSAQTGAADGMILVTRTNDNPDSAQADDTDDGQSEVRIWRVVKCKDGPENATGAFKLQSVVIGHDADGEEVASAVVQETALPKGKKKRATALKGNAKLIFETLLELVKQPSSTQIPKTLWRDAAYTKLSGDAKRKNQIFNRDGVNKLVEIGYVDKVSDTHYAVSLGVGIGLTQEQLPSATDLSATVGV